MLAERRQLRVVEIMKAGVAELLRIWVRNGLRSELRARYCDPCSPWRGRHMPSAPAFSTSMAMRPPQRCRLFPPTFTGLPHQVVLGPSKLGRSSTGSSSRIRNHRGVLPCAILPPGRRVAILDVNGGSVAGVMRVSLSSAPRHGARRWQDGRLTQARFSDPTIPKGASIGGRPCEMRRMACVSSSAPRRQVKIRRMRADLGRSRQPCATRAIVMSQSSPSGGR